MPLPAREAPDEAPAGRSRGPAQKERSERSRDRVMRAAIELIAEEGLSGATGQRIAARSGVSWGGIQHQFGGKEGVLEAVLERVLRDFVDRVDRFSTREESLEGRVEAWVEASWALHRDPTYRAFREVMRAPGPISGLDSPRVLGRVSEALASMRQALFPELEGETLDLMNLVLFATLAGMVEQGAYALVPAAAITVQLAVLGSTLCGMALGEPPLAFRPSDRV